MIYTCCDELRRAALANPAQNPGGLNGIDFLEVVDHDAPTKLLRQRLLNLHFVNNLSGGALAKDNFQIIGGERIAGIVVTNVTPGSAANILTLEVNRPGDFSIYTLQLVQDAQHSQPPPGYDPILSAIDFSFKVECPSDFDCRRRCVCPPQPRVEPDINYLAKDYASFRQLMLDRMSALAPEWQRRHAADLGITLVETLAFVGDYLSYQQDAVATEAYLGTARRRVSIRRHARLVDYFMHDGCNARAWVQVQVNADAGPLPKGTQVFTRIAGQKVILPNDPKVLQRAQAGFETMHDLMLFKDHNAIPFYTWMEQRCCLPKSSTTAALDGHFPNLKSGDVLIFEEVLGPDTGQPGDAHPAHRQAVRLTQTPVLDVDPLNGNHNITKIVWDDADALTFPLCISARTDEEHGETYLNNSVSFARGNIVLCDHGLSETNSPFPDTVPQPTIFRPPRNCDHCNPIEPVAIPPRFRPVFKDQPLTQAAPFDITAPASAAMTWDIQTAVPAISLRDNGSPAPWLPQKDLLNSSASAQEFVVEIDTDGSAYLRFGDDLLGKRPDPGTQFTATYRVGNGVVGNVGADSLAQIVTTIKAVTHVRNPIPAQGGADPETIEEVRKRAPFAFRRQERAVTEADYAEVTGRDPRVQRAAATFRWTGSWHTVFLTADRLGGLPVDDEFKTGIRDFVERYRMAGYDLEVDGPRFVSLEIEMHVCVKPDYFRSDVEDALLQIFSDQILPDGSRGIFHPDNFTFGQPVYVSPLYAAAQAVDGVASVEITIFQRQQEPDTKSLQDGFLPMGRLEIARCDNDPNFPEHGVFRLTMGGGK